MKATMKTHFLQAACLAAAATLLASQAVPSAEAAFALAPNDPGSSYDIVGEMAGWQTYGSDMDGMLVTAYSGGVPIETLVWADTTGQSGGVIGANWSLQVIGDDPAHTGSDAYWQLFSHSGPGIERLVIDAVPGRTVFDSFRDDIFTPGSFVGGPIGNSFYPVQGIDGSEVTATYRNQVELNGTFYGDLYGVLDITFDQPYFGTMKWWSDTDNITAESSFVPSVPEPSSLVLYGLSAIGLTLFRSRR